MPEPSPDAPGSPSRGSHPRSGRSEKASWRRPIGVAPGTWRYVHEGTIATRYDEFVAATPLCQVDMTMLSDVFPGDRAVSVPAERTSESDAETGQGSAEGIAAPLQKKWVFDLGCGTGRASEVLAANGYEVAAVDLSIPMLREVAARQLSSVVTIQANLVELDAIADDVAHGAVCLFSTLGMIQGRANRRQFLTHVRRIVAPEGRFYLHVHHRYSALSSVPGIRQLLTTGLRSLTRSDWEFGDAVYAYRGLPDMFLHQFSRRELMADFAASGWRVDRWVDLSIDGASVRESRWGIAGGFLIVVE
ncbi:class I SAM-dependent methyltransferase [Rhodopirellula sp. SWK7]|uniref:class I SAM-dependent methyltransferase n=1 Tax=Rhodopirellula sp. SWK7 TaxID=595460 RepID=UPI0005C56297|nr:class I SAM-dependent methyltransferase [Rhodopirellula sp. SWK7]